MTDVDALLAAILAKPKEDTPRLVYADWLDDQVGGLTPRAEFIRAQIELSKLLSVVSETEGLVAVLLADGYVALCRAEDEERVKSLSLRERELLTEASIAWLGTVEGLESTAVVRKQTSRVEYLAWLDLPIGAPSEQLGPSYRPHISTGFFRGFVSRVTCDCRSWFIHGDALRHAHPIERVMLTGGLTMDWWKQTQVDGGQIVTEWQWVGAPAFRTTDLPFMKGEALLAADDLLGRQYTGITFNTAGTEIGINGAGQEFNLPDDWLTRDYSQEGLDQMRAAGRRRALERERRILDAVIGPGSGSANTCN